MTEVAPATTMPAKVPKKEAASRTKKSGLSIGELIIKAVSSSKERNNMSLSPLMKTLQAARYDVENNNHHVKIAIRNLVAKGILVQTRGTSASGAFKLKRKQTKGQKPTKEVAPKAKKAATKKPNVAKKPKKVVAKKPTVTTKKSAKKAKKPPAAAKKATKSLKKAKKNLPTPKKAAKISKKTKIAKSNGTKPKMAKAQKAALKKK